MSQNEGVRLALMVTVSTATCLFAACETSGTRVDLSDASGSDAAITEEGSGDGGGVDVNEADSGSDAVDGDAGTDSTGASDAVTEDAPDSALAGDADAGMGCDAVSSFVFIRYMVENTGSANVRNTAFYVDASWMPGGSTPTAWWGVHANGQSCYDDPRADILLGGSIATADGGFDVPSGNVTWTISGNTQPQTSTDAVITLAEWDHYMMGTGNFWIATGGTIAGHFVAPDCYELVFIGVPIGPAAPSGFNDATGTFTITGASRVGQGCQ